MPIKRRHRQRTPHYDRRRRVVKLGEVNPWWDPLGEGLCIWAAYQPAGATSFNGSLLDLSPNANNAGDPGGAATPGWNAANGWVFDGAGDYLTTTFVPQNDQSQSVIMQYTNVTDVGVAFGANNGANRVFSLRPDSVGDLTYANGGLRVVVPALLAGNMCIAGPQGYRNGAAEGAPTGAWAGASALATYIGAWNTGAPGSQCALDIRALAIYDCALTAPQVLAIATVMAAL